MKIKTYSAVYDGKRLFYRFEVDGKTQVYTKNYAEVGDTVDVDGRGYFKVLKVEKDKAIKNVNVLTLELDIDRLTLIKK